MRYAHLLLFCLSLFFVYSCSENDSDPVTELIISTEQLVVSKDGETKSFHVKSNTSWNVSCSEPWCTVSPTSGKVGTVKVELTVPKNETSSERTATVTVSAGDLSKQINVTQSAAIILTVAQSEYNVVAEGDEIELAVQSSGTYTVSISADWITAIEGSELATPKFNVVGYNGLISRSGTITLSLNGVEQIITINQTGVPLTIPADNTGMNNDAMALAQQMGVGWNIGNSLEASSVTNGVYAASETLWGNPKVSKTLIDAVKAAGFNTVRIPCAWSGYIEDTETYRIKESWLERVSEVVDYCVDNDMYAIINIHWDGGWLEEHPLYSHQEEVNKKQKALWEQIAVYFRDYDEHLLFAGTNEVHADYGNPTAEHIEVQETYNQTFVDAVRSTGGKNAWRNLVVQAYNTNIGHAINFMTMPEDAPGTTDRLMAEMHFYDPYDFTLDVASSKYLWGAAYEGNPNRSDWGQEAWVDDTFESVKTKFIDNGIPVILGEYGATYRASLTTGLADHIASRNHYLNYVTKAAKDNGLIPVYWDNGHTGDNGSGLFNRTTGAIVHNDAVDAIISAVE